jgi:catechol 2,3-dioxygenase-like lactoylglutathione lyase family enzyme
MTENRTPMFDHLTVNVSSLEASRRFYSAALAPLGFEPLFDLTDIRAVAYGATREETDFWIAESDAPTGNLHLAFASPNREGVDEFHAAALEAGGKDNGRPGLRPQYHDNYYGAYVFDPDGNNIEAVFHGTSRR